MNIRLSNTIIFITFSLVSPSSVPSFSSKSRPSKIPCNDPNKFVAASPLAMAAVCSDGVVIMATHNLDASGLDVPMNSPESREDDNNEDLPLEHRGPLRIERIDGIGSCLVAAGWRTDCSAMSAKCRSVANSQRRYGDDSVHGFGDSSHGRILADGTASWMAQCAFSDNVRSPSCVGLLATIGSQEGFLWFLDVTGAYRVRALSVGLGSSFVNNLMAKIDFSVMTKEEGSQKMLDIFNAQRKVLRPESKIVRESLVEIVIMDSANRSVSRPRQPLPALGNI